MSLDKQQDMQAVLESMGEEYGIKFTPEQEKRFILSSTFGVPIRSMQKYLDLPEDQRDKILKNEGIPCDSELTSGFAGKSVQSDYFSQSRI